MASSSFLPAKDAGLLTFAQNYSAKITASPETYNLTAAEASALATLVLAFATALAASTAPETRTAVTVAQKDLARAAMVASIRNLSRRIQATPSVTPDEKIALGLPVHKTTQTPIPAPATKPVLTVTANGGRSLVLLIKDETTLDKKAKPFGVDGAEVYSFVPSAPDQQPPADLEQWRFEGIATRASFQAGFNPDDVGKTAYVLARWFNPRGEPGPASAAVNVAIAA